MSEKAHFKLSASGSATWLNCSGSLEAQKDYANQQSSYAAEGTLAHELGDQCLKNNQDAEEWIDRKISCESDGKLLECIVTAEMAKYVQEYLDYVRAFETEDTKLFTEDQVDFSNIVEEGFGTMDSAVLDFKSGMCHIFDLKYGKGVEVKAYKNSQGMIYAAGFYNELKFLGVIKEFTIHIVQPRRSSFTDYSFTVEELETFIEFAKFKAQEALKPNAKRTPGDKQCQWCKANTDCPALFDLVIDTVGEDFENLDQGEEMNKKLTDKQIKKLLDNKDLIETFLSKIQKLVFEKLSNGEKFQGYKLVRGKSNRKWNDEAETQLKKLLGDEAYEKHLIGITAAEKKLKKKIVDPLTFKPEGKIQLAFEDDKRPEVKPTIEDFKNIEDEFSDL